MKEDTMATKLTIIYANAVDRRCLDGRQSGAQACVDVDHADPRPSP